MPQLAGLGNGTSTSCERSGAAIERSPHPSVTAPAAVAAVVRNVRREIGVIETSWRRMVQTVCGEVALSFRFVTARMLRSRHIWARGFRAGLGRRILPLYGDATEFDATCSAYHCSGAVVRRARRIELRCISVKREYSASQPSPESARPDVATPQHSCRDETET